MKLVDCSRCGSKEVFEAEGYLVCAYCQSRFVPEVDDHPRKGTVIDLHSDIKALLKKCIEDPANQRRYANLILDIDPSNCEAMRYLIRV